jgi:hypothetical protein
VRTYVTLSIDDEIVARAQEVAARRGTSVNQLIRDDLNELVAGLSADEIVEELDDLWRSSAGTSKGRRWTREELHERSGLR